MSAGSGPQLAQPLFAPTQDSPPRALWLSQPNHLAPLFRGNRPGETRFVRERSTV